jgi:23S rRNA (uracil1939-C5)-methyltransferase
VVRLAKEGPDRRIAPCGAYDGCGGCRVQHLNPEAQREAKRRLVRDALERIGGIETSVPRLIAAGGEFGYRNRVTFSTARSGVMGLRSLDDPARVVDVAVCLLAEPPVQAAWQALRGAVASGDWKPPADDNARLTLRASSDGSVDLTIRGVSTIGAGNEQDLLSLGPGLVGVHVAADEGVPQLAAGATSLPDRWQEIDFDLPAGVFMQVNRAVSGAMDRWLDAKVGDVSGMRVLDLYSGVGARAIRWASKGGLVTACEVSERAATACREAAASVGAHVSIRTARVEDFFDESITADMVVVNPPRAGMSRSVCGALVDLPAERLAYVSCDPATLARDLDRIGSSWKLTDLQPFDAFPQTAHVETVAWLERP